MLPLFSYWLHRLLGYWGFRYLMCSEQLQLVVAAVKEGMKEELSSLKRELVGEREQSGNRLLKKLRLEKLLTFRKKSHEH